MNPNDNVQRFTELIIPTGWNPPPKVFVLARHEVHVWRANLDLTPARLQSLYQILAPDEQARAGRFRFQKDRDNYTAARGLLRTILGRYLDMEPAQLSFGYGPYGKPGLLAGLGRSGLNFNMAHSHRMAIYGLTYNRCIGVDLERIQTDFDCEQIAARFFTPQESATLRALPPALRHEAFFNGWTRKEAYIKARGEGLAFPLDQFEISLTPGEPARLFHVGGDVVEANRWSLQALKPDPAYAAALVVEGRDWQLKCWHWSEP